MSSTYNRFIYPEGVDSTPEELFEEFKAGANPGVFEKVQIPDGATISSGTHFKAFVGFCEWLKEKGFIPLSKIMDDLPMLEIPAQVTLTNIRRSRRAF